MAKLTDFSVPQKSPSLKGVAIVTTWRGVPVLKAWPKRRSRPLPLKTVQQSDWFRQIGSLYRYLIPEQQLAAYDATRNTPIYPRDAVTMAAAGTLFSLRMADGRILYSMSTRQAVSDSLDVLGSGVGGILVRQGDFWVPLSPPAAGMVLGATGTTPMPQWVTTSGGGGGQWSEIVVIPGPVAGILESGNLDLTGFSRVQLVLNALKVTAASTRVGLQAKVDGDWLVANYGFGNIMASTNGSWGFQASASSNIMQLHANSSGWWPTNAVGASFGGVVEFGDLVGADVKGGTYRTLNSLGNLVAHTHLGTLGMGSSGVVQAFRVRLSAGDLASGSLSVWGWPNTQG